MKFAIFLLSCILSFPVLAQQDGIGTKLWMQPGRTISIIDGKIEIYVEKIARRGKDHAEIYLTVPNRNRQYKSMKQGDYMTFDYYEKNYMLKVLDVKLDDQKVLIQVTKQ